MFTYEEKLLVAFFSLKWKHIHIHHGSKQGEPDGCFRKPQRSSLLHLQLICVSSHQQPSRDH